MCYTGQTFLYMLNLNKYITIYKCCQHEAAVKRWSAFLYLIIKTCFGNSGVRFVSIRILFFIKSSNTTVWKYSVTSKSYSSKK